MNVVQLIPLTAGILNLLLTLFVLSRDVRSTLSRVYLLWGFSVTIWNLGTFAMFAVRDPDSALFWARFLHAGAIFLPISLTHLCMLIGQMRIGRSIWIGYAVHITLLILDFTPLYISGVHKLSYAYYSVAGPLFWIFPITYTFPIITVILLWKKRVNLSTIHRRRLNTMIVAVATLIFFGINDTLPIIEVYHYPLTEIPIFPLGSMAAIFYGLLVGYGVLQHQLLDIHLILSKIAAHIIRLLFVFFIALFLLLLTSLLVPDTFSFGSFFASLLVILASATIASIYFPRLFGQGEETLERRLLGDRFEYHDQLRAFIHEIRDFTDSKPLLDEVDRLLVNGIGLRRYFLILKGETSPTYILERYHPSPPPCAVPEITVESPVLAYFRNSKADYLSLMPAYSVPGETSDERLARINLSSCQAELCFPLSTGTDITGLLLLGEKVSNEPFTSADLQILIQLSRTLSLSLAEIRLKKTIAVREEMELIGIISKGLAHDLNNLFTPILTYLQIAGDARSGTESAHHELLPYALKNTRAIQAYLREAVVFSEQFTPKFESTNLKGILEETVLLCRPRIEEKNISIELDLPTGLDLEADEVLLQRLFANLIYNAVDASNSNQTLTIKACCLSKFETRRQWFRVEVADRGAGIPEKFLNHVFTPYFTTKDAGEKKRGSGLGLAICRKISLLHQGVISIHSTLGVGTRVEVDLPSRQLAISDDPIQPLSRR